MRNKTVIENVELTLFEHVVGLQKTLHYASRRLYHFFGDSVNNNSNESGPKQPVQQVQQLRRTNVRARIQNFFQLYRTNLTELSSKPETI